ncbi:MAG: protein translocase subunit SecD [Chloroflexi bacterium]|nr:protein translocase subunit SecD [Chloroflexota bacterium]
MSQRTIRMLVFILLLTLVSTWLAWPTNDRISVNFLGFRFERDISIRQGLDLRGGIQISLEADVPPGQTVTDDTMQAARGIIENRVNALGVSEPLIQIVPNANRILVELPGIQNPDDAIKLLQGTGLLEFIDVGTTAFGLDVGATVRTDYQGPGSITPENAATPRPTGTPRGQAAGDQPVLADVSPTPTRGPGSPPPIPTPPPPPSERVYHTLMTGEHLKDSNVVFSQLNTPEIGLSFKADGTRIFADYSGRNVGNFFAIVLDKRIISLPTIREPILGGEGRITGRFTLQEAQNLVIQLKYGALPVPLKVIEQRTVGPTLGQESIQKSILAGAIGLAIVALFMISNYGIAGVVADLALVIYAIITFALFKTIPVTLTLAGIAGFILSIGMAVDANILIFERMREELRNGRTFASAIEAGFDRAWTSIRDSNISTLITCAILFWFGLNFGSSLIRGFALTLALGVLVSMFTAITVSRTFLRVLHFLTARNPEFGRMVQRFV